MKPSPAESNTETLARVVMDALASDGIETESVRVVDHEGPRVGWPERG